jgi:replicative DNA helicase
VQAEQSLLGALMLENSTWELVADKVRRTTSTAKSTAWCSAPWRCWRTSDQPFDVITLAEALEKRKLLDDVGGMDYLAEIDRNTASAANAVHYARIVRFNSVLRQLVKAGTDITDLAFDTEGRSEAEILDAPRPRSSRSPSSSPAAAASAHRGACSSSRSTRSTSCSTATSPSPACRPASWTST